MGYDRKYGIFGGLGFNIANHFSIGFGYEQTVANYVAELGGSYDVMLSYQFGGKHHIKPPKAEPPKPTPPPAPAPKPVTPVAETKTATTEPPAPPATPKKPKTLTQQLNERMTLVVDKIAGWGIPEGHYVVVGVYKNPRGAFEMLRNIKNLGINALTFKHPENDMTYVYIEKPYATRGEAGEAMINLLQRPNFKNSKVWVLKVGK